MLKEFAVSQSAVSNQTSSMGASEAYPAIAQGTITNVTTSGTSQTAVTLGTNTNIVEITAEKACYFKIADTATDATVEHDFIPDGGIKYRSVRPGQVITVIQKSSAGEFSVCEGL